MGPSRSAFVFAAALAAACNALTGAADLDVGEEQDGGPTPGDDAALVDVTPPDIDAGLDATSEANATTPLCPPTDASLILCMTMDGVVKDESPNAFPISSSGVSFVKGRVGQAAVTTTSTISIADSPAMNTPVVTLEAFVRPNALPDAGARYMVVDFEQRFALAIYAGGALTCTGGGTLSAGTVQPGVWSHIACVHDSANQARAYINGALVGSQAMGALVNFDGGAAVGMNDPTGENFDGLVDEVRVFHVVRSAAEIAAAAKRGE